MNNLHLIDPSFFKEMMEKYDGLCSALAAYFDKDCEDFCSCDECIDYIVSSIYSKELEQYL